MGFPSFHLDPRIEAGITASGWTTPTPIQKQAIPHALKGKDLMGLAQTGTGKTAAFALPILQRLLPGARRRTRALVVAPTRELAEQIHQTFQLLAGKTGLRSATVYGGVGMNPQIQALRHGVEVIVSCPGRLLDHIKQGNARLDGVEVLVLDEADRMFDMGFLPDIRRILSHLPAQRQTMLFSATMPDDIRRLAHEILRDPVTVQVDNAAAATTVTHALYPVAEHLKTPLLLEILKHTDTESVLVFTRTKHRAKKIGERLAKEGYKAASIQGNLSQNRRQAALDGFRDRTHQVLVATDIAARGIDVSSISHVINYDMPDTVDAYTHRIGRTGRAARTGDAFTLVTPEDETLVRAIERRLNARIPRKMMPGFDYGAASPRKDTEFAREPRPPRGKPKARPSSRPEARKDSGPAIQIVYHPSRSAGSPHPSKPAQGAGRGPARGSGGGAPSSRPRPRRSGGTGSSRPR